VPSLNLCRPYSNARLEPRPADTGPQYLIEEQPDQDDLQQNSGARGRGFGRQDEVPTQRYDEIPHQGRNDVAAKSGSATCPMS
jgi:hypothetical protein